MCCWPRTFTLGTFYGLKESLVVIGPKPFTGDRAYDPVQHLMNCETRLHRDPIELVRRVAAFERSGFRHHPRTQPLQSDLRKGAKSVVPLADRAIGNLQQWLIGTYHGVSRNQLQAYLDEFVSRHNRREHPMAAFQTLLGLGAGHKPAPYKRVRGAKDLAKNAHRTPTTRCRG
jgi:hypothetical protein